MKRNLKNISLLMLLATSSVALMGMSHGFEAPAGHEHVQLSEGQAVPRPLFEDVNESQNPTQFKPSLKLRASNAVTSARESLTSAYNATGKALSNTMSSKTNTNIALPVYETVTLNEGQAIPTPLFEDVNVSQNPTQFKPSLRLQASDAATSAKTALSSAVDTVANTSLRDIVTAGVKLPGQVSESLGGTRDFITDKKGSLGSVADAITLKNAAQGVGYVGGKTIEGASYAGGKTVEGLGTAGKALGSAAVTTGSALVAGGKALGSAAYHTPGAVGRVAKAAYHAPGSAVAAVAGEGNRNFASNARQGLRTYAANARAEKYSKREIPITAEDGTVKHENVYVLESNKTKLNYIPRMLDSTLTVISNLTPTPENISYAAKYVKDSFFKTNNITATAAEIRDADTIVTEEVAAPGATPVSAGTSTWSKLVSYFNSKQTSGDVAAPTAGKSSSWFNFSRKNKTAAPTADQAVNGTSGYTTVSETLSPLHQNVSANSAAASGDNTVVSETYSPFHQNVSADASASGAPSAPKLPTDPAPTNDLGTTTSNGSAAGN